MAAEYVVITFKSYWYQKRFLPPDVSHKKDFMKNIQPRFQYLSLCIQKLPMITLTCSKSQNHTNSHLVKSSIYKKDKIARSFCISQICSFACGGENRPHSPKIDNYKVNCALLFLHKDWKYPLCILLMAQLFWVGATCVKLSQYQMPSWTNQKIHSPHLHNLLQFCFKKQQDFGQNAQRM